MKTQFVAQHKFYYGFHVKSNVVHLLDTYYSREDESLDLIFGVLKVSNYNNIYLSSNEYESYLGKLKLFRREPLKIFKQEFGNFDMLNYNDIIKKSEIL